MEHERPYISKIPRMKLSFWFCYWFDGIQAAMAEVMAGNRNIPDRKKFTQLYSQWATGGWECISIGIFVES
jgi:hypothetical protein